LKHETINDVVYIMVNLILT